MKKYESKSDVYRNISKLRKQLGVSVDAYPLDIQKICKEVLNIVVEDVEYKTPGLRGTAIPSVSSMGVPDIILLSAFRDEDEKNFDCAHELYHTAFHRGTRKAFNCNENSILPQNRYLEWQANEGGAELAVPYRLFLPIMKDVYDKLNGSTLSPFVRAEIAERFNVTDIVIKNRIENLKYEIHQYLSGVSLDNIILMSKTKQEQVGINIKSINSDIDIYEMTMFEELS